MVRSVIIFGNGLGRSVDPNFFDLERAMGEVWSDSPCLSDEIKSLISGCLPDGIDKPTSEDHLAYLQLPIVACKILNTFEKMSSRDFLNDHSRKLPDAVNSYIMQVASFFYDDEKKLPDTFINSLSKYVKKTKSHIATLNYDDLLYGPLIENSVLMGYSGTLIDGMINAGFKEKNLVRDNSEKLGWYLHLHGSPLFRTRSDGVSYKIKKSELKAEKNNDICIAGANHIVLNHVDFKTTIIDNSEPLRVYWEYLRKALNESDNVVILGYRGFDDHLNEVISSHAKDKKIHVVERNKDGRTAETSKAEWQNRFELTSAENVNIVLKDNILEFSDWDTLV